MIAVPSLYWPWVAPCSYCDAKTWWRLFAHPAVGVCMECASKRSLHAVNAVPREVRLRQLAADAQAKLGLS